MRLRLLALRDTLGYWLFALHTTPARYQAALVARTRERQREREGR